MHLRDSSTAAVMRRASVGPHALMMRRALQPYVPDRGSTFSGLGAGPLLTQAVTGVQAGVAVSSVATAVGTSIASAIGAGAAAGSVVPIIGTAIGAIIGLVASGVFNHRVDPEVGNFNNATALYRQNPQSVLNIADKYLVLAGLFDLEPGQIKGNIPIYKKYGRMGEQRFVTDMANLVYAAAQNGQITANDTPQSVFSNIVQPWINEFGFGPMSDANADMINLILLGLVFEYITGMYKTRWYSVGGDFQFGGLPPFSLPMAVAPTSSATPSPVANVPALAPVSELQRYLNGAQPENGTAVNYARGADGKFLSIPPGGMLVGQRDDGSWLIRYPTGEYVLQGSQLVPYQTTTVQTVAAPAPVTQLGPPAGTPQPIPIQTLPAAIQYTSSGGGGSYPVYAPQASAPMAVSSVAGIPMEALMIGGGLLVLILLMKRKGAV